MSRDLDNPSLNFLVARPSSFLSSAGSVTKECFDPPVVEQDGIAIVGWKQKHHQLAQSELNLTWAQCMITPVCGGRKRGAPRHLPYSCGEPSITSVSAVTPDIDRAEGSNYQHSPLLVEMIETLGILLLHI